MRTRERIITIRLMEKLLSHPAYVKAFGIEICVARPHETAHKKEK